MNIPSNLTVKEFLSNFLPEYTRNELKNGKAAAELAGTTITMVIESGSEIYNYVIKDGSTIEGKPGDSKAMLKMKISPADFEKMISLKGLDMILGISNGLTKLKYNALNSLKGSFIAELTGDDGSIVNIEAILNGELQPRCTFKMTVADSAALMRKDTNPVNLFMSGAMKIEGDMGFGMATQPLFV